MSTTLQEWFSLLEYRFKSTPIHQSRSFLRDRCKESQQIEAIAQKSIVWIRKNCSPNYHVSILYHYYNITLALLEVSLDYDIMNAQVLSFAGLLLEWISTTSHTKSSQIQKFAFKKWKSFVSKKPALVLSTIMDPLFDKEQLRFSLLVGAAFLFMTSQETLEYHVFVF
jgi:hypothetical protein